MLKRHTYLCDSLFKMQRDDKHTVENNDYLSWEKEGANRRGAYR